MLDSGINKNINYGLYSLYYTDTFEEAMYRAMK